MEAESAESWESGWRRRARLLFASDFLDWYVPRSAGRGQEAELTAAGGAKYRRSHGNALIFSLLCFLPVNEREK